MLLKIEQSVIYIVEDFLKMMLRFPNLCKKSFRFTESLSFFLNIVLARFKGVW